ncbi:hypothetical protein BYT27DRAFT_7263683 [Phlegmacium glaucopus]|nr:hypothetical protein BYT27DRAFT_7263683 [Phlegmacium glaucopus]
MRIIPVTTLTHAITSAIPIMFASATHASVHPRTSPVATAIFSQSKFVLLTLVLQGCGSAVPCPFKARNGPITTITQAKAIYKPQETVCGIQGRESTLDLHASILILPMIVGGGCMTPHPFFEADPVLHISGVDCTEDALNNIFAASLNLGGWCAQNVPTDFDLSGLLSELSLNNSTVAVGAAVSSDLVDQIKSFVGLVRLVGIGSSLPPPSPGSGDVPMSPTDLSPINKNIINSIINATADIINAPTATLLVSGIGALVNATGLASSLLDHCGCVNALGLGPLSANLKKIDFPDGPVEPQSRLCLVELSAIIDSKI